MAGRVTADFGANSMKRSYVRMHPIAGGGLVANGSTKVVRRYWGLTAGAALKLPNTLLKSQNFHHRILCRRRKKPRVGAFKVAADIPEWARYRKWQSRRSREAGGWRRRGSELAVRGCTG
jgi:hypothetical protein